MKTLDVLQSFTFWAGFSVGLIFVALCLNLIAIVYSFYGPSQKRFAIRLCYWAILLIALAAVTFLVDLYLFVPDTVG